ncbi:MAG: Re/Si-specific NAD(P)(+) transhydrogenase subunit alpha [Phycisphaera sp.]|nr:Re/Si-specific NAD(P)(+) transhydrogenase subunit alpha [Phycisphaera sp.]
MIIGVPSETQAGERRVAMVPDDVAKLVKRNHTVKVQAGAGVGAGFTDKAYEEAGATLVSDRAAAFDADIVVQVRCFGMNPESGGDDLGYLNNKKILVGHCDPLVAHEQTKATAATGVTLLGMELVPRTTRAQSMDALSSQANLAGYKAVLMAANTLGKILPMTMTAAGTIKPTHVFILGAGVAGLQAIATAKRLGAAVYATDIRPEVKEEVESLGGKFVMHKDLMVKSEGGYAKELTEEQKAVQRELLSDTVAQSDIVITIAAVPGKRVTLVYADMVARMRPGSVLVDLGAERGGNCELTQPGETIVTDNGVTIIGTLNIAGLVPYDASTMYSGNISHLLKLLITKEGELNLDLDDEVITGMLVSRNGEIVHERVRSFMGLEPLPKPEAAAAPEGSDQ